MIFFGFDPNGISMDLLIEAGISPESFPLEKNNGVALMKRVRQVYNSKLEVA